MARTRLYPPSVDPGFPELPPTPEGWTHATFADVLDIVERPAKLSPDATYRLLTAKRSRGGIELRSELPGREILTKTQFEAKAGDFLISRRQIIHGACGVVPADLDGAVVSNEYSTLRTRPILLMDFLRHYSHTPYFQRTCFHSSHGVDVEKMIFKIDEWLTRDVDVPPLGEQRKIAAILSSVDDAIEATQSIIDQLGVVKTALMGELLTRGLPGRRRRVKQTEIREVPEDWRLLRIADVLEDSAYGTSAKCESQPEGRPVFRIPNVVTERITTDNLKYAKLTAAEIEAYRLRAGDLLVIRTNGNPAYVGRSAVVPELEGDWLYASYLIRLRVRRDVVTPAFLHEAMRSDGARKTMQGAIRTSAGNYNLNTQGIANTVVPIPPLREQDEIVAAAHLMDEQKDAEERLLVGLRSAKTALMSVLLTGEVRVKPDEEAA
jgi:type I restriction enzyme S subunit